MAESSVKSLLQRCIDGNNPEVTRELIINLLDNSDVNDTIILMRALVTELVVVTLHKANYFQSADASQSPAKQDQSSAEIYSKGAAKQSLLGSISLPRPAADFEGDEDEANRSGSDIPSESSASSEDEMTGDDSYAEELWKQALSALRRDSANTEPANKTTAADKESKRPQTHKDLFDSLIRDIEADKSYYDVRAAEPHPENKLSLSTQMKLDIEDVIDRLVSQAEYDHLMRGPQSAEFPGDDDEFVLSGALLAQISIEVSSAIFNSDTVSFNPREVDDLCGQLTEALSFLYHQPVTTSNLSLLTQAVELEVHSFLSKRENGVGRIQGGNNADDDEDGDEVYTEEFEDLESADLNNDNEFINKNYEDIKKINEEELGSKDKPAGEKSQSGSSGNTKPELVFDDSSTASEKAFQDTSNNTPSKSASKKPLMHTPITSSGKTKRRLDAMATEGIAAWDLPKSPLDAVFRKGYGGLGQSDLREVIDLLTPSKKVARREARADDTEESAEEEEGEEGDEEDNDYEFVGVDGHLVRDDESNASSQVVADTIDQVTDDIPSTSEQIETSTTDSMKNNMNTYSMDNIYHYDHKSVKLPKAHAESDDGMVEFIGIEDLPDPSQLGSSNTTSSMKQDSEKEETSAHKMRYMFEDDKDSGLEAKPVGAAMFGVDRGRPKETSKTFLSKLAQKTSSREQLVGKKVQSTNKPSTADSHAGTILLSNDAEEDNPLPENHPVEKFSSSKAVFSKSDVLNGMIKKSFESFLKQYAPKMSIEKYEELMKDKVEGKKAAKKKSKGKKAKFNASNIEDKGVVIYDLHEQKIYQYDAEEKVDADDAVLGTESLDTQDYYNYVSSHSSSPKKDRGVDLLPREPKSRPGSAKPKTMKKKLARTHGDAAAAKVQSVQAEEKTSSTPSAVKKTAKKAKENTKVRSSSESKLLEPTAASKSRSRQSLGSK